jgi:hypothetical protein
MQALEPSQIVQRSVQNFAPSASASTRRETVCQTAHANARIRDGRPFYPTLGIVVLSRRAGSTSAKRRRQAVIAVVTATVARAELPAGEIAVPLKIVAI